MIPIAILNNVKQYKKREASLDNHANLKALRSSGVKLPSIIRHDSKSNISGQR
jgi:hypothetical protein